MTTSEPTYTNRLIHEKSPYLLQHAHNPVDWFPWGEQALSKAKDEDKPIFLSIGYSTCHWCHVMEKECFDDEEVAEILNREFVCIKVDREERPDLDAVYMRAAAYLGGGGGWPLSVFLTPDGKPYYAGTYIPKRAKLGVEGLLRIAPALAEQYHAKGDYFRAALARVDHRIERAADVQHTAHGEADPDQVFRGLMETFDPVHGGFGRGMKFPQAHILLYLLEHFRRTGNTAAREAVRLTLGRIYRGGVYDQLGFGVHRYSVDPVWLVPHFEKMLYDQALLSMAAVDFYEVTREPDAERLARDTFTYVLNDLRAEEGAFFSAEDADSEGEEGRYYLWTYDEIERLLDTDEMVLFERVYSVEPSGNWMDPMSGRAQPTNILHITSEAAVVRREAGADGEQVLLSARRKLLRARKRRPRPAIDDQILTDWNALSIASLARAGRVLGDSQYVEAAIEAYAFIQSKLEVDGRLLHRWRDGQAAVAGMLPDYTCLAWAATELYRTTLDTRYLLDATRYMDVVRDEFKDDRGGFRMTRQDAEGLILQPISFDDMAQPAGNSVALLVFSELARLTGNEDFQSEAQQLEAIYAPSFSFAFDTRAVAALAVERRRRTAYDVVVVDAGDRTESSRFMAELESELTDGAAYCLFKSEENAEDLAAIAPWTKGQEAIGDRPTAYVCRDGACLPPVTSVEALRKSLATFRHAGK